MNAGDSWDCPRCGCSSFLKKESILQGWVKVGEVLKCAACGAVVETIAADIAATEKNSGNGAQTVSSNSTDTLAALFGGGSVEKPLNPLAGTDRKFCRDCKHRIMNAFRIFCSKHGKDVNPMDDCPDFEKRVEPSAGKH